MRTLLRSTVLALTFNAAMALAGGDKWVDGSVTYKVPGVDEHFKDAADACKASADDQAKHGQKRTYESVKDGTSSTMMTCVLKEADGSVFEQTNVVTKILECPEGTSARSTDNSGEFSKMRCRCDDPKKCPAAAKAPAKKK